MRFSTQPPSVAAGEPFTVAVELLDVHDARVTTTRDTVTLTAEDGTPISGIIAVEPVDGVATFTNVSVSKAATLRLISASKHLSALSAPFTISAGAPTVQGSSLQPTSPPIGLGIARTLTFTFADAFGNRVANTPVSLSGNLTNASFSPASGMTNANGMFTTTVTAVTAGSLTITATVAGTPIVFSPVLVQEACAPGALTIPGLTTATVSSQGCVIASRPTAPFRFSTTGSGAVIFAVTASFPAAIDVTTDPPGDGIVVTGGQNVSGEWLLPAGTYLVRVGAVSGEGTFGMTASSGPGNSGQVVRLIATSGTFAQTLGAGDFVFPQLFGDNSFWDLYRVQSARSCTITARKTGAGSNLDLLLLLSDQSGELFALDDDSGGGTDPQIVLSQCQTAGGPITIMVNHYLETGTGPYDLTVTFGASAPSFVGSAPSSVSSEELIQRLRNPTHSAFHKGRR